MTACVPHCDLTNFASMHRLFINGMIVMCSHLAHDAHHGAGEEHDDASFRVQLEVVVVDVDVLEDEELGDVLDQMSHQALRLLGALEDELLARGENLEASIWSLVDRGPRDSMSRPFKTFSLSLVLLIVHFIGVVLLRAKIAICAFCLQCLSSLSSSP